MSSVMGYGVDLSTNKIKWRKNAYNVLIDIIKKHCPILRSEYNDELEANVPENYDNEDEFIKEFVDMYQEDWTGEYGIEGLILAVIKEIANDNAYDYNDCCIYYPAYIPQNEKEKKMKPTTEDIRKILSETINPLVEEPITIQWYDIYLR